MDVTRLSPEHQKYIERMTRESERKKKPKAKKAKSIAFSIEFDSATEVEYAFVLDEMQRIGRIDEWMYHPLKICLAPGCTYTPDFALWVQGEFVVVETKGSWKSKNARDSRTRLIMAQVMFPRWIWVDVTKDNVGFVYKVIGPLGADPVSIGFAQVEASILRLQGTAQPRPARESRDGYRRGPDETPHRPSQQTQSEAVEVS